MISSMEPASSSDEEDVDDRGMRDAVPEGDPPSLFAGEAIGPGMVEKVTVAHRWKNVRDGEVPRWRCEMITDQKMVGELWVKYKDNEQPQDGEGDERSKHEVRKEKKRLSEQKRRQDLKQRRQLGGFNHAPSREKAGTIRINKESVQEYEKQQKMDERFSSRGHRVNKRRRHNNPLTELQSKFAPVIKSLLKDEKSLLFRTPVDPKRNPGYKEKVKVPIDLSIIRQRCDECHYRSKKHFLKDIELMYENCKAFNRATNVALVTMAHELFQQAQRELGELTAAVAVKEAEAMVQLADVLHQVATDLVDNKRYGEFRQAPNNKEYQGVVRQPMDLVTVRNKAKEFSYSSREPFLEDIRLIRDNCIKIGRASCRERV